MNFRIGQQAADVEFFDSQTDDLFLNGTFGWPANKANNLPSGGPAPPIAVPGIRVKATLSDQITVFGAVFNGNAARPGDGAASVACTFAEMHIEWHPLGNVSSATLVSELHSRKYSWEVLHAAGLGYGDFSELELVSWLRRAPKRFRSVLWGPYASVQALEVGAYL